MIGSYSRADSVWGQKKDSKARKWPSPNICTFSRFQAEIISFRILRFNLRLLKVCYSAKIGLVKTARLNLAIDFAIVIGSYSRADLLWGQNTDWTTNLSPRQICIFLQIWSRYELSPYLRFYVRLLKVCYSVKIGLVATVRLNLAIDFAIVIGSYSRADLLWGQNTDWTTNLSPRQICRFLQIWSRYELMPYFKI